MKLKIAVLNITILLAAILAIPARANALVLYTYNVRTIGTTYSALTQFKTHVAQTYADSRGWSKTGARFLEVPTGVQSNFTVWLAAPDQMTSFALGCDAFYSCRVGRNVIINDDRWRFGSPYLSMDLDSYRHMVVNHETGHWFELDHSGCPGTGKLAPVMMQQSKGVLNGCLPNAWPTPAEIEMVRQGSYDQNSELTLLQAPVKLLF